MARIEFEAEIRKAEAGAGAWVELPFDVPARFGGKARVKVKAELGGAPYRGSLVRMGGGCHVLGVRKDILEIIGKKVGDTVHVSLEEDLEERRVEPHPALVAALGAEPALKAAYEALSYTARKEARRSLDEAKKPETLDRRLAAFVESLRAKRGGE